MASPALPLATEVHPLHESPAVFIALGATVLSAVGAYIAGMAYLFAH